VRLAQWVEAPVKGSSKAEISFRPLNASFRTARKNVSMSALVATPSSAAKPPIPARHRPLNLPSVPERVLRDSTNRTHSWSHLAVAASSGQQTTRGLSPMSKQVLRSLPGWRSPAAKRGAYDLNSCYLTRSKARQISRSMSDLLGVVV